MVHTFLILDGHPTAFASTVKQENALIEPKDQLPPYPLWSCMVYGTLEFCRMGWDLGQGLINVLVAGKEPIVLNDIKQQNVNRLQQQFSYSQPREIYDMDRLKASIDKALAMFTKQQSTGGYRCCRLVLLITSKDNNEQSFEYRNNENEAGKDIRLMLYNAIDKMRDLDHVRVDILRLFQHSNALPENIIDKKISSKITMSIHNIPNGQNDLRVAMTNLAQSYYNIGALNISNIPMKSSEHMQSTHTVSLFYKLNGNHLMNKKLFSTDTLIYDPNYSNSKQLNLIYLKRSKRAIQDSEWCTCRHNISPMRIHDLPTDVYVDMTMKGSISYLMTSDTQEDSKWTHILMAENNAIHLYCLDSQLQSQFSKMIEDTYEIIEVMPEGLKKNKSTSAILPQTQEFIDILLKPNLHLNITCFKNAINTNAKHKLITINPKRYVHHLPITHKMTCTTTKSIESATRPRKTASKSSRPNREQQMKMQDSKPKQGTDMEVDQVWDQIQRYESMTLREREDAAQGILPDFRPAESFSNQSIKINTNFRGRRGAPVRFSSQPTQPEIQKYPDPSLAVPYLNAIPPTLDEKANEEKEEMKRLGEPGNLLWFYWMNEKAKRRGKEEAEDNDQDMVLTYKKARKEFEGRMAQPGEKGETN
ncbi:hypothetical protein G6F57_000229 [Rhizopus arrhizus]|uniref:Uncharacterized protein n=1 Tax=Rhizopus oryzae TaxID=64495 RepID=A0A9P6XKK4_RHIOR|nr:hypothetical protein G6F30_000726 [Rhizopus arrhizus]KAG1425353.1 hypothetical protein G6F58_001966 [Rhizopus delemar]KAG0989967.1 hypothetical protein G6F29_000581 [Rhizopus arrhizus]KAG1000227.1 hypothetical protein G6F28_000271 [Rhizopus arrhizus]KAG1007758.1 hypothetical protein G6F27_007113 [Rhizopus arrhizus]